MKSFLMLVLFAFIATAALPATAQDSEPTRAFATVDEGATMEAKDFREEVAKAIVQEAAESDTLTRFEKRRIERVMRGGWFNAGKRERVIDAAVAQMHSAQVIEVTPEGVQAAINWDGIASFLERLMPLILTLVKLFGG